MGEKGKGRRAETKDGKGGKEMKREGKGKLCTHISFEKSAPMSLLL